jgi:hypothetical protein
MWLRDNRTIDEICRDVVLQIKDAEKNGYEIDSFEVGTKTMRRVCRHLGVDRYPTQTLGDRLYIALMQRYG